MQNKLLESVLVIDMAKYLLEFSVVTQNEE